VSSSMRVAGSTAPPRHVRVLHVDDEAPVRDLAADFLERLDGEMSVASESDPRAVPERIEAEPVDCVVSDKRMPECDGIELCRRVRGAHPDLPFVVFTSEHGADVEERAREAGATAFVRKTTDGDQYERLATSIREAVEDCHEGDDEVGTALGSQPTA